MTGRFSLFGTADGHSASIHSSDYGLYIEQDGLVGVFNAPVFKEFENVNWLESDGLDCDLNNVVFAPREFTMKIVYVSIDLLKAFIARINSMRLFVQGIHIDDLDIDINARFEYIAIPEHFIQAGTTELTFVDDNPTIGDGTKDATLQIPLQHYIIDGIDIAYYRLFALEGSDKIGYSEKIKDNITINNKYYNGQVHIPITDNDGKYMPKKEAYDVNLNLLLKGGISEYISLKNAFFKAITSKGVHTLNGENCYYNGCDTSTFRICRSGNVWHEFSVTFKIIY